ncbi:Uncharacterised protein g4884 [Pycnogonum litorale]
MACILVGAFGAKSENEKLMTFLKRFADCSELFQSDKKSYCKAMDNSGSPWIGSCALAFKEDYKDFIIACRDKLKNIADSCLVDRSDFYKFDACVVTQVAVKFAEINAEL